jgi:hypothetical protein
MKRTLALAALSLLLFLPPALADSTAPSYVELADAPTITVDWSKGNMQAVMLHDNRTLVFANGQRGGRYTLIIKQDATGSRIPIWPPQVHWPGENQLPPMLTTTANKKDYFTFIYDGMRYDGVGIAQSY